ncbi:DUF4136 domain-containing protein [Coraliomargarita algicola]|uniref:DUF4136 domain-containing protein n=1 Tax=Coraliomargarita algicola TaxID=3092156 RepID=A0ABZ0RE26_9BACT|nr:DUF4136 domain-containing protein [Coraliomargarita sp. J2-16]WPJ94232.1 DUF4136 domain-containing protein [Coraliomargarita sp. J2-16]
MKPIVQLLLLATLFFAGCVSPTTVDYDRSAKAKLSNYKCFVIDSREERSNYQDIVLSPIVDRRIEQAISRTLQAKGMSQDCAQPDFRVTFNTITKTKTEVNDLGVGPTPFRRYPYHGYGAFSRIDVNQYEEGTFIVDIIDQASKELVWRGTYTKRLGWSAPNDQEVQQIVSEILASFPPQSE